MQANNWRLFDLRQRSLMLKSNYSGDEFLQL
jgi:hypothetical protein